MEDVSVKPARGSWWVLLTEVPVDLVQIKDHLILTGQFLLDFSNNQIQVTGESDIIEVIGRYAKHRA